MINMDTMDDSENNAKISDSAYSNSCSNSQSRRSSKSTHSGSNSSGSSGYGGKPSTSGYSSTIDGEKTPEKRLKEKESKKKKQAQSEMLTTDAQNDAESFPEPAPIFESPKEDKTDVANLPSTSFASPEMGPESMEVVSVENTQNAQDEVALLNAEAKAAAANKATTYVTSKPSSTYLDGFSCVISMKDGVVMYTTASLTTTLGFPKDMWVGRSFIDFVHPRDRNAFASQITNGLVLPKNTNGTNEKAQPQEDSSMVCRIRRYRDLTTGFGVKNSVVTFMPFMLKLSCKSVNFDDSDSTYLVIQATPYFSAFKTPNEVLEKAKPFVIRHAANGNLDFLDPESVPYLGYLPQDVTNKDALHLYHPNDLAYLRQVYEIIVREGVAPRSKPYRMMAQNGYYVTLETEWSSFINPWSKKLEFVIGKHHIIEGPANPDVFQSPETNRSPKYTEDEKLKEQSLRDSIVKIMNEALTKPAEVAKQQMNKRCQDLASFMETLLEDQPKTEEDVRLDSQDPDQSYYERDSVMLGGISPHHDYSDSKSSTETPISYNQLNYNDTLHRYFESHPSYSYEDYNTATGENILGMNEQSSNSKDRMSPIAGGSDSYDPILDSDYQQIPLTEALLTKHNAEMEKELVKMHRESRSSSKGERETSIEKRQKKKEHLARCNASFQPTSARMNLSDSQGSNKKAHGVKRMSKLVEPEMGSHKHHCPSPRLTRRRMPMTTALPQSAPPATAVAASQWQANPMNSMNAYIMGMGIQQPMPIVSPVPAMPGMYPVHYVPAHGHQMVTHTMGNTTTMSNTEYGMSSHAMPGHSGAAMAGTSMGNPMAGQIGSPVTVQMAGHPIMIAGHPMTGHPMSGHPMTGHPMAGHTMVGHPMAAHPMHGHPMHGHPMSGHAMSGSGNPVGDNVNPMATSSGIPAPSTSMPSNVMPTHPMPVNTTTGSVMPGTSYGQYQAPAVQCMMYGQAVYGAPFMYSTINPHVAYPVQQPCISQGVHYVNPLGLASSNYVEACKPSMPMKAGKPKLGNTWRMRKRAGYPVNATKTNQGSITSNSSANRSSDARMIGESNNSKVMRLSNSDDTVDKTDGESSYSSFYSSFFKTESGSAEESSDPKKPSRNKGSMEDGRGYSSASNTQEIKKVARRNMEPPWMEHVCVSSELVYKYQVRTKTMEEVLKDDKQKMKSLEQPALVNEQLGQLYLDLQLEGVAARLTLEEGITSSSSSGEETIVKTKKIRRKKREYSQLVMIYEENAPLPSPESTSKPI